MYGGVTFRIDVMGIVFLGIILVVLSVFLLCVSQLLFIPIGVFTVLFLIHIIRKRELKIEDYLFFVFLFFSSVSIFVAKEKIFAVGGVLILLIYYFFFYVGKNWDIDFRLLSGILGVSLVILSIFGVVFYVFPNFSFYLKIGEANLVEIPSAKSFSVNGIIRSPSITPNPVIFSSAFMYVLPIVLSGLLKFFSDRRFIMFLLFIFLVILGFSVIVFSSSRSFLVLFPIVVLVTLFLYKRYDLIFIFFAMIFFIIVIFWGTLEGSVVQRVIMIFDYQDYASFFNRLDSYNIGIRLIKDNFLFGVGLVNFKFYVPKYFGNYIHNLYLSLLVEVGVLGFISFVSTVFVSLYKVFKSLALDFNPIRVSFLVSIFTFLIHGLIDNTLYVVSLGSLFWLFLGMSLNDKYFGFKHKF